jgi:phage tail sheath protein FI
MVALLHPGVYVQEVPSGVRSIEGVPTSTCIFVGETERGPTVPTKIRGASDYARLFGGHLRFEGATELRRVLMRYAVDLFFQNGGTAAYVLRASWDGNAAASPLVTNEAKATHLTFLVASSPGEWGSRLYAVYATSPNNTFRIVIYYAAPGRQPAFVEDWDRLSANAADANYAGEVLKRSSYVRWVDGASPPGASNLNGGKILELTPDQLDAVTPDPQFTGGGNDFQVDDTTLAGLTLPKLDGIDDAAIIVGATEKWVNPTSTGGFADDAAIEVYYNVIRSYTDTRPKLDLFYVADTPPFATDTGVSGVRDYVAGDPALTASTFAAVYWPHLEVGDPVGPTLTSTLRVPPAGAIAGIFARTDNRRGVWKAPAGVEATVNGVVRMQRNVIDGEQDELNPVGINVVRPIPGAGTVVWGARTLVPTSEWRYVPVRRTAMYLRKSIFNGIQFAVFEPNDTNLWGTLRATITAFMDAQFRNGAFAGATAREAFFVKVDAETTTPADQAAGVVNILVGFAPLRPAEFVVVTLSQKTATT